MLEVQGAVAGAASGAITGAARTTLVAFVLLAGCVWVGSLACLGLVGQAARRSLDTTSQVALFRALGRRYGTVGTGSLLLAIGCGIALSWPPARWDATIDAAVGLCGVLVLATVAGMAQARAMVRLRRGAAGEGGHGDPGHGEPGRRRPGRADPGRGDVTAALRRGRRVATGLRLFMSALSVAVVILAAVAMTR